MNDGFRISVIKAKVLESMKKQGWDPINNNELKMYTISLSYDN